MSFVALRRVDIPVEQTWNLEDIFPTKDAWEQELTAVDATLPSLRDCTQNVGRSATQLLAYLHARDAVRDRVARLQSYASYLVYEDSTNPNSQAMSGRAKALGVRFAQVLTEVRNQLLELPDGVLEQFLTEETGLSEYRWYIERLIQAKPHRLSSEAELALAAVGGSLFAPERIYETFTAGDIKFEPVLDGDGKEFSVSLWSYFTQVETSPDSTLRRNAFHSLTSGLRPYQHGLGSVFATEIERNVAMAKLRGYSSTAEMLLNDSSEFAQADHAPITVFEQALDIIQTELAPHMRRYARLRKRVLGLDKLYYCDVKAPLDVTFNPKVTFAEAGQIITDAVAVLGDEYQEKMRKACFERWVYQGDNIGRGMIAFGDAVPGVHGYSFYPWGGNFYDVPLLGHELGHAVHLDFANETQRASNQMPAMLFIEAPSTLNEHLIVRHLRDTRNDPKLHRWLDMYLMMSYHHNFVTHILEAELLRRLYRMAENGQSLSSGLITETKGQVLSDFWGDTVEIDEGAKLTWMRQPHYYSGLYPYTYSVGLTASTVIAKRIATEGQEAGKAWVEVLKMGGNRSAFDLFKAAGLDMSAADVYRDAVAYVGQLVDKLEASFQD